MSWIVFTPDDIYYNEDGTLTVTIANPSEVEWFVETILSFGEDMKIIEPLALRQLLKEIECNTWK